MKVRIIGAGAVGAVVADRLSGTADTAFIAEEERKERYSQGLMLNGRTLSVPVLTPSVAGTADLIIFAVKNFSLDDAMETAAPFVGEETVIMSLLNGIEAEERLSGRFGEEHVIPAFITDLSSVHSGLETTCFSDGGRIVFGEKDGSITERVVRIRDLFESAGQRFTVPDDILHEKWWKFMLNTCFNTLSAILDADYAAISSSRDFIRAVRLVAREVQQVASREGVRLTQEDVESMITHVTALRDHGRTSMLQDVGAGRETENRYFAGAVSRLGKKHSVPVPVCDFIQILLEARRDVVRSM